MVGKSKKSSQYEKCDQVGAQCEIYRLNVESIHPIYSHITIELVFNQISQLCLPKKIKYWPHRRVIEYKNLLSEQKKV